MTPYEPPGESDATETIESIDLANHGGINSFVNISYEAQCPGSTVTMDNASFMDDVAQYLKTDKAGIAKVRNQAYVAAQPNTDTTLVGRQDSDPAGG